jgi:hypothetical protein
MTLVSIITATWRWPVSAQSVRVCSSHIEGVKHEGSLRIAIVEPVHSKAELLLASIELLPITPCKALPSEATESWRTTPQIAAEAVDRVSSLRLKNN